jgi:hypothetical protein
MLSTQTLVPRPRGTYDDALLTFEEVDRATFVAEWAFPGGRVLDIGRRGWRVERPGAAYAVEVVDTAGRRWDLHLRADFSVVELDRW